MSGSYRGLGKGALVSHRCNLQLFQFVQKKLGAENLRILLSSQLGNLFPFPDIQFQGQIYNILLRHLDIESIDRNRMGFTMGGMKLDFSPCDFALITGLRFGSWSELPIESETHRFLFKQRHAISLDDISEAFKAECRETEGKSLDSLRLGCLLILYGVFLTNGPSVNHVDMKYFHLIDDVEKFLTFPWGQVAYDSLMIRTHRARLVLDKQIKEKRKLAFDANCFVVALQVWSYEVLPTVGRHCAVRIEGTNNLFPRMKRWCASMPIKFEFLFQYLSKATPKCITPMSPTQHEVELLKVLGIEVVNSVTRDEDNIATDIGICQPLHGIETAVDKVRIPQLDESDQTLEKKEPVELHALKKRLSELERIVESMIPKVTPNKGEAEHSNERVSQTAELELTSKKCSKKRMKRSLSPKNEISRRTGLRSNSPKKVDDEIRRGGMMATISQLNVLPKEDIERSSKKHICTPPKSACSVPPVEELEMSQLDPNEEGSNTPNVEEFEAWRARAASDDCQEALELPGKTVGEVSPSWFDCLWRPRGWLNTSHIDGLLNLLVLTQKQEVSQDWGVLEMICWEPLCKGNTKMLSKWVSPYVVGLQPESSPMHWGFLKHVYGVGHLHGDHWVAYHVSLEERCVTVFDSQSMSTSWESVSGIFEAVCSNIEMLCTKQNVWSIKGGTFHRERTWRVVRYEHPPQQPNNHDCGILAMKYIECLIAGKSVDLVDPSRCGFFRKAYCGRLFKIGKLVDKHDIDYLSL